MHRQRKGAGMFRKSVVSTLAMGLLLAFVVGGCASVQKGGEHCEVDQGRSGPHVRGAVGRALCALYSGSDLVNSQIQYDLTKGDKLGFSQDDAGQVWAVGRRPQGQGDDHHVHPFVLLAEDDSRNAASVACYVLRGSTIHT